MSSNSDEKVFDNGAHPPQVKRKKGFRNTSQYKSEVIKKARVSGAAYRNWKGNQIGPIVPGNDCK